MVVVIRYRVRILSWHVYVYMHYTPPNPMTCLCYGWEYVRVVYFTNVAVSTWMLEFCNSLYSWRIDMFSLVRYFGGIKLGTGGLVRAYGGVAAECLKNGQTCLVKSKVIKFPESPFLFDFSQWISSTLMKFICTLLQIHVVILCFSFRPWWSTCVYD